PRGLHGEDRRQRRRRCPARLPALVPGGALQAAGDGPRRAGGGEALAAMRWKTWLGLTLSLAACRETVVLDQGPYDGSVGGVDGLPTNCGAPVQQLNPPSPTARA